MAEVDNLIEQGKAAIKAGRKDEAKAALTKAVELDEASEQGWLWLSACVESVEEQQICLENVLAINPANEKAKKGLAAITQKSAKPSAPAAPPPPPPAAKPAAPPAQPADPFDGYDSNIFAGTGFDSNPYESNSDSDPALGSGWGSFDASLSDESISNISTSVDWGRDNEPSAYGSGKDVKLPSSDEYDSWVSNLSLGGSPTAEDTGFSPSDGPFSSAAFDLDIPEESSFSSPPEPPTRPSNAPVLPFDDFDFTNFEESNAFSSSFDSPASPGPFSADPTNFDMDSNPDPFGSGFGKKTSPMESPMSDDDDPFSSASEVDLDSDPFADLAPQTSQRNSGSDPAQSRGSDPFGNSRANVFGGAIPAAEDAAPGGFAFIDSNAPPSKEAYFSAIPLEIQADGAVERPDNRLIMTVAVLAALNVLSIAFLLMNLTSK
jgi:hypothetical protein